MTSADGLLTGRPTAPWMYQRPADPAQPAPAARSAAEQAAAGRDLEPAEHELNRMIGELAAQRRSRPAHADPGDLGELEAKMRAAAAGEPPDFATLEGWEAQLAALIRQPAAARQPAPEPGSLPARLADIQERLADPAGLDGVARHQVGLDLEAAEAELSGAVQAAQVAGDTLNVYSPPAVELDEQLAARAKSSPYSLTKEQAATFEEQLNAHINALAASARTGARPALPEPAAPAAQPAKPAAKVDSLATASPEVLLKVIERLNIPAEQLAGLVAGNDEGAA